MFQQHTESALDPEKLERYEAALQALKPEDREAIIARVELGMSYADIALERGKPSSDAARMAVSRAVSRLAEKMRELGQ